MQQTIGYPIIYYNSIHSTHEHCIFLLTKIRPQAGSAIMAGYQSKGRGQYGRQWESPSSQNLLCSLIIYPTFLTAMNSFALNVFCCLAISDLIKEICDVDCAIKWPNDIYVDQNKIAGILIQNTLSGHSINSTVLSIGLNINQIRWEKKINASSLRIIKGESLSVNKTTKRLFELLSFRYTELQLKPQNALHTFKERMYGFGKQQQFLKNGEKQKGIIRDIGMDGRLTIVIKGQQDKYTSDQIKLIVD